MLPETKSRLGASNVHDRSEQAGIRYDLKFEVYLQDGGMDDPKHSVQDAPRRWVLNDAIYEAGGSPGGTSGRVELGCSLTIRFEMVRAPSQIDAIRDGLEVIAAALDAAEMAQRGPITVVAEPSTGNLLR